MNKLCVCDTCGIEFESITEESDAWAEFEQNFPGMPHDEVVIVCDECYQKWLLERNRGNAVNQ